MTAADAIRKARLLTVVGAATPSSPGLETGSTSTTALRTGLCNETAEAPLALPIFQDSSFERRPVEVRPIHRHEHQLTVSRLPQQKIRQPLLAAGADDQIGIGDIGGVQIAADGLGADLIRLEAALRYFLRHTSGGAGDLLARAARRMAQEVAQG